MFGLEFSSSTLYVLLFFLLIIAAVLGLTFLVIVHRGRRIDPTVRTYKQATQAIRRAQALFHAKTGFYTYNYYNLISFLKANGYLPEKTKSIKNKKIKVNENDVFDLDVLNQLDFTLSDDNFVIDVFKRLGLPISKYLSAYGCSADDIKRTSKEIYNRIMAMQVVIAYVYKKHNELCTSEDIQKFKEYVNTNKFEFTEIEKKCLLGYCDEQEIADLSWLVEGVYVLGMVLGINKKIYPPYAQAPMDILVWMQDVDANKLEINKDLAVRMLDVYYGYAWTIADQHIHGKRINMLNTDLIFERYKALLWLFDQEGTPYDEVEVDT